MLLHEIIASNDIITESVSTEFILRYRRSIYNYYKDLFCCEPVLFVTDVFNAVSYAKIVPILEFQQYILDYIEENQLDPEEEELISFNSVPLREFLLHSYENYTS